MITVEEINKVFILIITLIEIIIRENFSSLIRLCFTINKPLFSLYINEMNRGLD